MKALRPFMILLAILLILGLVACVRSVSPSSKDAQKGSEELVPGQAVPTNELVTQLELFVTQTAMASMGTSPGIQPGEVTPLAPPAGGETPTTISPYPAPGEGAALNPTPSSEPLQTSDNEPVPVVVPTPTPGIPDTYTLHTGEHIYCIARRFNVNPAELLNVNGLGANSLLYAGTSLKIPQSGNPFPGSRTLQDHPTTHSVQAGESIYSIACLYGDVSPEAIAYANSLNEPYNIKAGQKLYIP